MGLVSLKRSHVQNSLVLKANGRTVLLLREQDEHPSPFICDIRLSYLQRNNEKDGV